KPQGSHILVRHLRRARSRAGQRLVSPQMRLVWHSAAEPQSNNKFHGAQSGAAIRHKLSSPPCPLRPLCPPAPPKSSRNEKNLAHSSTARQAATNPQTIMERSRPRLRRKNLRKADKISNDSSTAALGCAANQADLALSAL